MRRLILMSLLASSLWACAPEDKLTRTIGMGAVIDRVGNNSEPSWESAIQLAGLHATEGLALSGLVTDLGFQVEFEDNLNEPTVGLSRAQKLVREQNVKSLILDTSQVDVAVNETYYDADPANDLNVPLQCGSCTSGTINNPTATGATPINEAALRNGLGWNFRSIMSTKLISKILLDLMLATNNGDANDDGKFKISYIASDEVFGKGTVKDLKAFAGSMYSGTTPAIVEEIYHPRDADPNSYDWSVNVQALLDNKTGETVDGAPDVIVVANFAQQQAAFVKAFRQSGSQTKLLHYHTFRISAALQSLGSLGNGVEGVSHVSLDNAESGDTFARLFEEEYGVPVVYRDAIYYDNAMTLLLASAIAAVPLADPTQVTGQQVRDAMWKVNTAGGEIVRTGPEEFARALKLISEGKTINYEGASGPMDFDATGNVLNRLAQYRAEDGRFIDVAKYDCVANATCPKM